MFPDVLSASSVVDVLLVTGRACHAIAQYDSSFRLNPLKDYSFPSFYTSIYVSVYLAPYTSGFFFLVALDMGLTHI
jgi:hypothetical protein